MDLNFLILFLLAHLTGDFILQTDKIANMKAGSMKGIAIHCSIITIAQVLLLSLFGFKGVLAGLAGGFIHIFIDYLKLLTNRVFMKVQFLYFVFDQAVHIAVITVLTIIFSYPNEVISLYTVYLRYLVGLIFLVYVTTVAVKILLRDLFDEVRRQEFFKKNERYIDSLAAVVLWSIFLLPIPQACIFVLIFLPLYIKIQKKELNYGIKAALTKYLVLMSSAAAVFYFIAGKNTF